MAEGYIESVGVRLGNAMKEMHASILKARNDLERHSIEGLMSGEGLPVKQF